MYMFSFQIDYLNSKKLLSEADLPSVSKDVVNMEMTFRSLKLLPDQTFNNLPVTKNTSTIQVPTNVFDRCKYTVVVFLLKAFPIIIWHKFEVIEIVIWVG